MERHRSLDYEYAPQAFFRGEKVYLFPITKKLSREIVSEPLVGTILGFNGMENNKYYGPRYIINIDGQEKQLDIVSSDGTIVNYAYQKDCQIKRVDKGELEDAFEDNLRKELEKLSNGSNLNETERASALATLRNLNAHLNR